MVLDREDCEDRESALQPGLPALLFATPCSEHGAIAATANSSQPTIQAMPPMGTICTSGLESVASQPYSPPLNSTIPASSRVPAAVSHRDA